MIILALLHLAQLFMYLYVEIYLLYTYIMWYSCIYCIYNIIIILKLLEPKTLYIDECIVTLSLILYFILIHAFYTSRLNIKFNHAYKCIHQLHYQKQCCICFNYLTILSVHGRHCEHLYHKYCLEKWLTIQKTCPLCRKLI